jgi:carnitine-CoA ligase
MTNGFIKPSDHLGSVVSDAGQRYGDRPFLLNQGKTVSFGELDRASGQYAKGFAQLGLLPGDRVAVMLENCAEYLYAWFGAAKAGLVEVSINTSFKGTILRYILDNSAAAAILLDAMFIDVVAAELQSLPELKTIIVMGDAKGLSAHSFPGRTVVHVAGFADLEPASPIASPVDIAVLGYTSGTTGPSKGAMLTHNRIVKTGEQMAAVRGVTADDNLYSCLPLFHGNAKFVTIMPALVSGARASIGQRFSASQFWAELRAVGATQYNYLGVMISVLLKQDPSPDDRAHAARLGWGAGALKEMVPTFEERFGTFLMEGYGLTEGGIALSNSLDGRRLGSCGKPMPGYEADVVDEWDNPVKPNEQGELVLRSRWPHTTMAGYYGMPDKSAEIYRNFWLHTGDLATRDEDGFFYFVDRKKDAIRRRGENISSFEVEAAVNAHEAVLESAAFAVKSDIGEDDVMVTVVLRPGMELTAEALCLHCAEQMPYFWVPRYLRLSTDPLPRTATNKVEKYRLRDMGVTADTWDRETSGIELARTKPASTRAGSAVATG